MDAKWKSFCYQMNHSVFTKEKDIEDKFGLLLDTLFGWYAFEGRLKHQVPVTVGHQTKYADIVLYHGNERFVIEMKGVGVVPSTPEEDQLKSYMKILGCEFGMIANDKTIWLYNSPYSSSSIHCFSTINIDENDAQGSKLSELLTFDSFSVAALSEYKKKKDKERLDAKKADELARLLSSFEGKELLQSALESLPRIKGYYDEGIIRAALAKIEIKVKGPIPEKPSKPPVYPPISTSGFTGFAKKGIPIGSKVVFKGDPRFTATVCGDKQVMFEGREWTLSGLAKVLYARIGKLSKSGAYHGAVHFMYNGTLLLNLPDVKP